MAEEAHGLGTEEMKKQKRTIECQTEGEKRITTMASRHMQNYIYSDLHMHSIPY